MARITERDVEIVRFTARAKFVNTEILKTRFGICTSNIYKRLAILSAAGYLSSHSMTPFGRVHFATAEAIRQLGLTLTPAKYSIASLTHDIAIANLAALFEKDGKECLCERELRAHEKERFERRFAIEVWDNNRIVRHFPDMAIGGLEEGRYVAIEIELSQKSAERRRNILRGFSDELDINGLIGVIYIVGPNCKARPQLATIATEMGLDDAFAMTSLGDGVPAAAIAQLVTAHNRRLIYGRPPRPRLRHPDAPKYPEETMT